jgi:hypothetical protein
MGAKKSVPKNVDQKDIEKVRPRQQCVRAGATCGTQLFWKVCPT